MNQATQPEFFAVLQLLWRERWTIILCTVVVAALFTVQAVLSTPIYRAEALVVPNKARADAADGLASLAGQFGGIASLAGVRIGSGNEDKNIALALLTARQFLSGFIEKEKLLPVIFSGRWDAHQQKWKESWRKRDPPSLDDAVDSLRRRIVVTEDRRTGLIKVTVEWRDRELAASWANKLIGGVNEEMRSRATHDSQRSQEFLRQELKRTDLFELTQAIYRLLEVELKNEMVASVTAEYAFKVIDPAKPAQKKKFVRPRRALMVALGVVVGGLFGIGLVLVRNAFRAHRGHAIGPR